MDLENLKDSDTTLLRTCRSLNLPVYLRVLYRQGDAYFLCTLFTNPEDQQHNEENGETIYMKYNGGENIVGHCHHTEASREKCYRCRKNGESILEQDTVRFVTTPNVNNMVDSTYYTAYGNEPSVGYLYGNVILVVDARLYGRHHKAKA